MLLLNEVKAQENVEIVTFFQSILFRHFPFVSLFD